MEELEKLKKIEKSFKRAYEEVCDAMDIIDTVEGDFNRIYPRGMEKFLSQLRNYYSYYNSKVNHYVRESVDEEVVKKGGQ